ncbi:MAG: NAD kinase [Alphaproteobacteria bacterium]|nr:NAD kinase [Alphaproteobacteria bacterium]
MKFSFYASQKPRAQKALEELKGLYGQHDPADADALIVLGGDGTMLRALHAHEDNDLPIFGMNLGTLGFLLNPYDTKDLEKRIEKANRFTIHPLRMEATDKQGKTYSEIAFNEVSLLRETHNSAKIRVLVNGKERISELVCDGIMVSSPVGSTAYNSSAGGPIVPLDANVLPVTPISAFRPRRWPGALVSNKCEIKFEILKAVERPVSATADAVEVRDVREVTVRESRTVSKTILYDPDNPLEERIFEEQFAPGH